MSGHSKWSKIKHQKAVNDSKKSKTFTRVVTMIKVASRKGIDPSMNPALRVALDKAKEVNMPKDNIQRLLDKASSGQGQEVLYEAFGPEGIGLIIKAFTDNTNRTVAEVRIILTKNGGSLATSGAVSWMFQKTGHNEYIPSQEMDVSDDTSQKIQRIIELLEENDDVEQVWSSIHLTETEL